MAALETCPPLTHASVLAAHDLVKPFVHHTPVLTSRAISAIASTPRTAEDLRGTRFEGEEPARPVLRFWFKCENLQKVGAFKARGAFHAIERLKREEGWVEGGGMERGVVTHSSGNHAQALAYAARENGVPAHIIMPSNSNPLKIAATRGYGANVTFSGPTGAEREAAAAEVIARTGGRLVPPYDHPDIILGQGTMGLELQAQASAMMAETDPYGVGSGSSRSSKGLDAIITPCGGGGMLSGVALSASASASPLVFGAEPLHGNANDAQKSYYSGARVPSSTITPTTIADGLRVGTGAHNFSVYGDRDLVAGMHAVTEEEILAAMRLVMERAKMVVEPSACVGLAVALFDEGFRRRVEREGGDAGWDLGVVLSGGNVGVERLVELFGPK